jgi:hypothetical protein
MFKQYLLLKMIQVFVVTGTPRLPAFTFKFRTLTALPIDALKPNTLNVPGQASE